MVEIIAIGAVVLLIGGWAMARAHRGRPNSDSGDGSVHVDSSSAGDGCSDADSGGCDGGGDGGGGGD